MWRATKDLVMLNLIGEIEDPSPARGGQALNEV
jgi:hypothetical protein